MQNNNVKVHHTFDIILRRRRETFAFFILWRTKSFNASHKQSKPPKSVVRFIFGLNISDQLGYLIIERWSNIKTYG